MSDGIAYHFMKLDEWQSTLIINENLQMHFPRPRPNWWWRLWQWLLLGWKWEVRDAPRAS